MARHFSMPRHFLDCDKTKGSSGICVVIASRCSFHTRFMGCIEPSAASTKRHAMLGRCRSLRVACRLSDSAATARCYGVFAGYGFPFRPRPYVAEREILTMVIVQTGREYWTRIAYTIDFTSSFHVTLEHAPGDAKTIPLALVERGQRGGFRFN